MRGKRYKTMIEKVSKTQLDAAAAIADLKSLEGPKFDETIDVAFNLGVDPKAGEQTVRGSVVLPHGSGKNVRILVIAKDDKAADAKTAGADYIGDEDMIEKIQGGWLDFDKVIASPDMMAKLSKVARILGPKGLMPNPKLGTVTPDIKKAVADQKKGAVAFRVDKGATVHGIIGKKSFNAKQLEENYTSLFQAIQKARPAAVKGDYIKSIYMSTSMGPSVAIKRS
jgi:large subunit ribosomal protein L1